MEIGGVTNVELGARLRYEFTRRFAPYVGVESAATGDTCDTFERQAATPGNQVPRWRQSLVLSSTERT